MTTRVESFPVIDLSNNPGANKVAQEFAAITAGMDDGLQHVSQNELTTGVAPMVTENGLSHPTSMQLEQPKQPKQPKQLLSRKGLIANERKAAGMNEATPIEDGLLAEKAGTVDAEVVASRGLHVQYRTRRERVDAERKARDGRKSSAQLTTEKIEDEAARVTDAIARLEQPEVTNGRHARKPESDWAKEQSARLGEKATEIIAENDRRAKEILDGFTGVDASAQVSEATPTVEKSDADKFADIYAALGTTPEQVAKARANAKSGKESAEPESAVDAKAEEIIDGIKERAEEIKEEVATMPVRSVAELKGEAEPASKKADTVNEPSVTPGANDQSKPDEVVTATPAATEEVLSATPATDAEPRRRLAGIRYVTRAAVGTMHQLFRRGGPRNQVVPTVGVSGQVDEPSLREEIFTKKLS